MSQELVLSTWCDPCARKQIKRPAAGTYVIALFGEKPKEIDLCSQDYSRFVTPLADLMAEYGVEVATRRASLVTEVGALAPTPSGQWVCPIDGARRTSPGAMITHGQKAHGVRLPKNSLDCAEHDFHATALIGTYRHYADVHGQTVESRADAVLEILKGMAPESEQMTLTEAAPGPALQEWSTQCPCGQFTGSPQAMQSHIYTAHDIRSATECPTCGREGAAAGLSAHRRAKHGYTIQEGVAELQAKVREQLGIAA